MSAAPPPASAAHWSDYWASGALTSLPQDFAFNYDGEVRAFWHQQFEHLPEPGQMLDTCTGNGPIALLAAAWAADRGKACAITAVDAAVIRPDEIARRHPTMAALVNAIQFLGETPVEELPFDDQSFDLVTSQYGLEYCRLDAAARTLQRILRPGGRLAMVSHSPSSEVIATMTDEQRDYQMLETTRFFRVLRSWLGGQLAELDLRNRLGVVERRLNEYNRGRRSPLIGQVLLSLAGLIDMYPAQLRRSRPEVAVYMDRMEAGRERLEDMLRVNCRIADDPDWQRPLAEAGLNCLESRPLIYRGQHPMGQSSVWQRPL